MVTNKELKDCLNALQGTRWFEDVARAVFGRLAHGKGNGLMILQGPSKIANKTYFLKMVKASQKGVPGMAKEYFSEDMQRFLEEVGVSRYQCVDVGEEYPNS